MKRRLVGFSVLLAVVGGLAGCGGSQSPDTASAVNANVRPEWGDVFVVGHTAELHGTGATGAALVVQVRTSAVREMSGATVASLVWSRGPAGGSRAAFLGPPSDVAVSADGSVRFFFNRSDIEIARGISTGAAFGPLPAGERSVTNPRSGTVSRGPRDGELCFEEALTDDADCEDVCGSRFCIWEGGSVSALGGAWAPEQALFQSTR